AATVLRRASIVKKLFDEIAPRYAERNGGYTRVVKLGHRLGDAAHLSVVELVERKGAETEQASPKKKAPRRDRTKEKEAPPARRRAAGAERFAAGWRDGAPPRLAVLAPRAPRKSSVPPKLRACAGAAGSPRQRPVPPSRAGGYLGRTEHVYTFVRSRLLRA